MEMRRIKMNECAVCKFSWNDRNCVINHFFESTNVFFCLNFDDWIKEKRAVFYHGWSLFDEAGFLRQDV
jgi:hypothetical protein